MSTQVSEQEADEFVKKVEELERQVKGVIDGSISVEEIDEKLKTQEQVKKFKEEEKKRDDEKKLISGRKGKGHKGGYKKF